MCFWLKSIEGMAFMPATSRWDTLVVTSRPYGSIVFRNADISACQSVMTGSGIFTGWPYIALSISLKNSQAARCGL